jgi:hypothetical protein
MPRVRLRVVIDEPDRAFAPGDPVRGRVEVEADEDAECTGLTASVGWRTAGEANVAEGPRTAILLGSGQWKGGDRASFPFALVVPPGPPTYEGRHFALLWTVRAEASLSFAFDAKGEAPVRVVPGPAPEGTLLSKEDSGCLEAGCATVSVGLLLGGGLPVVLSDRFPGIGYVVAGALGGLGAAVMIPQALAYRGVGKATVEIGPSPVARGEEIACRVTVVPRRDLEPRRISATLIATEKAPKGSGKSRKILTAELAKSATDLEGPKRLEKGRKAEFAGMVPVPASAPPSLDAGEHKVTWSLKVSVEFAVLPDPGWEFEVTVA